MMNAIDRFIMALSPSWGLQRAQSRTAAHALMHYDAATPGRRGKSWRPVGDDADAATRNRDRVAFVSRDMVRNTPYAARARDVIVNNTVGDGIVPSVDGVSDRIARQFDELWRRHMDTTAIDADGRNNLYGLQRLALSTVVESGEVLIRIRYRRPTDGLPLPFQLQLLEPDFIDKGYSGRFADSRTGSGSGSGNYVHEGIEYDPIGRRVAYYLYNEHPGALVNVRTFGSRRVPADEVIHVFRPDRPGQTRGISWFAPVALPMQDLRDYVDAQVMRQKIAACFAAFRRQSDAAGDEVGTGVPSKLSPGAIHTLGPGEDMTFADPPTVTGFDEFVRTTLREIAAGLGITYEALSGDLSEVNFSSARMGRMEMERNVSSWQWLMLIPQMMDPVAQLFLREWQATGVSGTLRDARISWTPPARVVVDPNKEYTAMKDKIRSGLSSWQRVVRELGHDPEQVAQEIAADNELFDRLGIKLESDTRNDMAQSAPAPAPEDQE